jgi:integrase
MSFRNATLQTKTETLTNLIRVRGLWFHSKRARSGHITDREVSKQWLEAKRLAGVPESVVLYCARHRFSTDAMEGTGNVMAVMDAMGHQSVNTTRIYSHTNVWQIREAIERRNQQLSVTMQ